jgi:hypothetical protein
VGSEQESEKDTNCASLYFKICMVHIPVVFVITMWFHHIATTKCAEWLLKNYASIQCHHNLSVLSVWGNILHVTQIHTRNSKISIFTLSPRVFTCPMCGMRIHITLGYRLVECLLTVFNFLPCLFLLEELYLFQY